VEKSERVVPPPSVAEVRAPAPGPQIVPAPAIKPLPVNPVKAPEPIAELEPVPPTPAPLLETPVPAATPPPAAIATVVPHYGPAPIAPVQAQAPATPAPASLLSAAGKLAGAMVPLLAEKVSLPSLPGLPGTTPSSAPSEGVNAVMDPKAAEAEAAAAAKAAEANVIQTHNDAFVIVKGINGSGSGFACRQDDKTWLFSNIHVVSEIKQPTLTRLDGVTLSAGAAEVAAGPDIARMVLTKAPEHPLEMITDFEANVHIGDDVLVLGNSGGGGVVTSLKGKVVGIGPDRIEVSAEFIPGNSGSPIVHLKTGKVIGIATYLTRRYEQFGSGGGNGSVVVRRFGYRLDKVPVWEPVNWPELYAEADQLEQVSKLTEDIFNFLDALRNKKDPTFATDTLRRPAQDWTTKIHTRNMSDSDRLSATQSFLTALRFMVRGDVAVAQTRFRYVYFRNRLKDEEKVRDRMYQAFDSELAKLGTPLSRHSFR
ncbi:MAG TPA: trypsin-like peptidase domain-containing protein, partial [Chthoniobacter sp.]|nr:trypsin-like peptidase domain-containing protein [Chthoniobacter sp.]